MVVVYRLFSTEFETSLCIGDKGFSVFPEIQQELCPVSGQFNGLIVIESLCLIESEECFTLLFALQMDVGFDQQPQEKSAVFSLNSDDSGKASKTSVFSQVVHNQQ